MRKITPGFVQSLVSLSLVGGALLLGPTGCGGTTHTGPDGGTQKMDMASGTGPKVTGLPTNCSGSVIADQLFTSIVKPTCATMDGCHRKGDATGSFFFLSSSADMKAAWINKPSQGGASLKLITPANVNESYVMYKLMNQQDKSGVNGGGSSMPLGKPMLSGDQLCQFIQWINGGAN